MSNFKNLTPHDIHIVLPTGREHDSWTLPRSGHLARAASECTPAPAIAGIPTVWERFGAPVGLPEWEEGVFLVVSTITAQAALSSGRRTDDLFVPGAPIRDGEGRIIGCAALARVGSPPPEGTPEFRWEEHTHTATLWWGRRPVALVTSRGEWVITLPDWAAAGQAQAHQLVDGMCEVSHRLQTHLGRSLWEIVRT